ncbi:hypothetical protein GCM10023081_17370 [Arthrobacter ginkgonis]|uniref:Gram-positive cocci surface proteins LPxTG domain-containing protein n=2 Tax=Arthrobacter ginkgonis TaxID=1630594 RepID=A0ABP7C988_9MICC
MAVVALAGSLTFLGAGAATAAPEYPGGDVTITVPSGSVNPGESVSVSGSGYDRFETVTIKVFRGDRLIDTFEVTADADGNFNYEVPLGYRSGTYTILAVGDQSGVSSSVQVSVADDDDDDDDSDDNGSDGDDNDDNGSDDNGSDDNGSDDDNDSDDEGNGAGNGNGTGTGTGVGTTAGGPASLANTGLDSGALMLGGAGVLLLGAGATAVVVSRRKNA